jgi:hypothetical protein
MPAPGPIGALTVGTTANGLALVVFGDHPEAAAQAAERLGVAAVADLPHPTAPRRGSPGRRSRRVRCAGRGGHSQLRGTWRVSDGIVRPAAGLVAHPRLAASGALDTVHERRLRQTVTYGELAARSELGSAYTTARGVGAIVSADRTSQPASGHCGHGKSGFHRPWPRNAPRAGRARRAFDPDGTYAMRASSRRRRGGPRSGLRQITLTARAAPGRPGGADQTHDRARRARPHIASISSAVWRCGPPPRARSAPRGVAARRPDVPARGQGRRRRNVPSASVTVVPTTTPPASTSVASLASSHGAAGARPRHGADRGGSAAAGRGCARP